MPSTITAVARYEINAAEIWAFWEVDATCDDVVEGKSVIQLRNTNRDLQSIVDDSTQNPIEALFAPAME